MHGAIFPVKQPKSCLRRRQLCTKVQPTGHPSAAPFSSLQSCKLSARALTLPSVGASTSPLSSPRRDREDSEPQGVRGHGGRGANSHPGFPTRALRANPLQGPPRRVCNELQVNEVCFSDCCNTRRLSMVSAAAVLCVFPASLLVSNESKSCSFGVGIAIVLQPLVDFLSWMTNDRRPNDHGTKKEKKQKENKKENKNKTKVRLMHCLCRPSARWKKQPHLSLLFFVPPFLLQAGESRDRGRSYGGGGRARHGAYACQASSVARQDSEEQRPPRGFRRVEAFPDAAGVCPGGPQRAAEVDTVVQLTFLCWAVGYRLSCGWICTASCSSGKMKSQERQQNSFLIHRSGAVSGGF